MYAFFPLIASQKDVFLQELLKLIRLKQPSARCGMVTLSVRLLMRIPLNMCSQFDLAQYVSF